MPDLTGSHWMYVPRASSHWARSFRVSESWRAGGAAGLAQPGVLGSATGGHGSRRADRRWCGERRGRRRGSRPRRSYTTKVLATMSPTRRWPTVVSPTMKPTSRG